MQQGTVIVMKRCAVGVIAVGGRGARLGNYEIQKCLTPLDGKPILDFTIEAFEKCGIGTIILLSGHHHLQVAEYLAQRDKLSASLLLAYGDTRGEANAITRVSATIKDKEFICAGGDVVFTPECVEHLLATADKHPECIATISLSRDVEIAPTHLYALTDPSDNYVSRLALCEEERVSFTGGKVGTGLYHFRSVGYNYLATVPDHGPMGLFAVRAIQDGEKVAASDSNTPWYCLHTPEDQASWRSCRVRELLKR